MVRREKKGELKGNVDGEEKIESLKIERERKPNGQII